MEKSSELQTGPCIHICERRQNTLNNLLKESAQKGHIINLKKWIKAGADIDASNNDKGIIMDFDNLTMDQSLRGVLPSKKSSIKSLAKCKNSYDVKMEICLHCEVNDWALNFIWYLRYLLKLVT